MPNTPAMVGEGMTGLCYDEKNFTEEEKNIIENIFIIKNIFFRKIENMIE